MAKVEWFKSRKKRSHDHETVSLSAIVLAGVVLLVGVASYFFYTKESGLTPPSQGGLTPEQVGELEKGMTASPTSTPTISGETMKKLQRSMSAPPVSVPVLENPNAEKMRAAREERIREIEEGHQ